MTLYLPRPSPVQAAIPVEVKSKSVVKPKRLGQVGFLILAFIGIVIAFSVIPYRRVAVAGGAPIHPVSTPATDPSILQELEASGGIELQSDLYDGKVLSDLTLEQWQDFRSYVLLKAGQAHVDWIDANPAMAKVIFAALESQSHSLDELFDIYAPGFSKWRASRADN